MLLYLESFGNPRKFARIARRVARKKPILAMKSGRTRAGRAGRELAHRRARRLGGRRRRALPPGRRDPRRHARGAARRGGACSRASRSRAAGASPCSRTPAGSGSSAPTPARRPGSSCPQLARGDARRARGSSCPREASVANPVDMLGSATGGHLRAGAPAAARRPGPRRRDRRSSSRRSSPARTRSADAICRRRRGRTGRQAGARGRDAAPRGLRRRCSSRDDRRVRLPGVGRARARPGRRARRVAAPPGRQRAGARRHRPGGGREPSSTTALAVVERGLARPRRTRELLGAYGIPLVPERRRRAPTRPSTAAHELGYPVVVKTATAGAHKTETGGVALDLAGRAAGARGGRADRRAGDRPADDLKGGTELLAGVVQDPVFGPLVAFGPGGVFAELIGEATFRIAPLTDVDAEELVTGGKAGRLVAGFRGAPASDAAALVDLVHRLAPARRRLPRGGRARPQSRDRGCPTAASPSTRACASRGRPPRGPSRVGELRARAPRRLLARGELPLGRADLPARQPAAARAAARRARQAAPARPLRHDARA